eukprot:tig00000912_g5450.t1
MSRDALNASDAARTSTFFAIGGPSSAWGLNLPAGLRAPASRVYAASPELHRDDVSRPAPPPPPPALLDAYDRGFKQFASEIEAISAWLSSLRRADKLDPPINEISRSQLIIATYQHIARSIISHGDVHEATAGLPNQADAVRNFLWAQQWAGKAPDSANADSLQSHLFIEAEAGAAGLFLEFNGQGYAYLDELKQLYETYPFARGFIRLLCDAVRDESGLCTGDLALTPLGGYAVDGMAWVENRDATPNDEALTCSAVSFPLVFVTQVAHFYVCMKMSRRDPRAFLSLFKGATGHSQGIWAAAVLAACSSEDEMVERCGAAARALFHAGLRGHLEAASITASVLASKTFCSVAASSSTGASAMLSIRRLLPERVQAVIDRLNRASEAAEGPGAGPWRVEIGLKNGPRHVVACGAPPALQRLYETLRQECVPLGTDQSRVPFSKRKPELDAQFLAVSAPFHFSKLARAAAEVKARLPGTGFALRPQDLHLPVYAPSDGRDMRSGPADLAADLVDSILVQPLRYDRALAACNGWHGVSHLLNFGPGSSSVAEVQKRGTGVTYVSCASMAGRNAILSQQPVPALAAAQHWGRLFAPKVVRLPDGSVALDTRFVRAVGKPPLMIGGMTPSTTGVNPVAAALRAGYHVELAGGGLQTPEKLRGALGELAGRLLPGDAVTLNLLFLDPYLWGFQYPLVLSTLEEGEAALCPIDGICIGAGVPSPDKAAEILAALRQRGARHVAFKPGSVSAINAVVDIAKANPESTVLLQWTGGRAGGHHSFEDVYEPLLYTYAKMRSCENLVLVAGSGVGDGESAWQWLSGEWSTRLGYPPMPFDAVLLASRVCACAEMDAPAETKARIAATPGIENEADWEKSYEGEAGGIITVTSELGEPIHVVNTRGMRLWRDLDREVFSQPKEKQAELVRARKDAIAARINADFQKVVFGCTPDGRACELADMTYAQVAERMLQLMHVVDAKASAAAGAERTKWVDWSYKARWADWLRRTAARFNAGAVGLAERIAAMEREEAAPAAALQATLDACPDARLNTVVAEDCDYFMEICRRPGLAVKPINFIPAVDGELKVWFKRDSLFYSQDLDCVPGRDVERTMILMGPVAVRYIKKAEERVGDVMDSIHGYILEKARSAADLELDVELDCDADAEVAAASRRSDAYQCAHFMGARTGGSSSALALTPDPAGARSRSRNGPSDPERHNSGSWAGVTLYPASGAGVPASPSGRPSSRLAMEQQRRGEHAAVSVAYKEDSEARSSSVEMTIQPDAEAEKLPETGPWLDLIAGERDSWIYALLHAPALVRGARRVPNPYSRIFRPRPGIMVRRMVKNGNGPTVFALYTHKRDQWGLPPSPGSEVPAPHSCAPAPPSPRRCSGPTGGRGFVCSGAPAVEARLLDSGRIAVTINHVRLTGSGSATEAIPLTLEYETRPRMGYAPLLEVQENRSKAITDFYRRVWSPPAGAQPGAPFAVQRADVERFCRAVGHTPREEGGRLVAPLDFAVVAGWEALMAPVVEAREPALDLAKLVHLSNDFTARDTAPLREGDRLASSMRVTEFSRSSLGLTIAVAGALVRADTGAVAVEVSSSFLVREAPSTAAAEACCGPDGSKARYFKEQAGRTAITLPDARAAAVLADKPWLKLVPGAAVTEGAELVFELRTVERSCWCPAHRGTVVHSLSTGRVLDAVGGAVVAEVAHESGEASAVLGYLARAAGTNADAPKPLPGGGYSLLSRAATVRAPHSSSPYSAASRDHNPIHNNPFFAELVGFEGPIVHGMWTSAQGRRLLEQHVCVGRGDRIRRYRVSFVDTLVAGDELALSARHVGMRGGFMAVDIELKAADGRLVLRGQAEIEQRRTAYVFTGQGSAGVGMGMDLYASSGAARAVWDRGDRYLRDKYGFSILDIVRRNPTELTVHFGGTRGKRIRENYLTLSRYQAPVPGEEKRAVAELFPGLTEASNSYTYRAPEGLLFATQFQQPAILLYDMAVYAELKQGALLPETLAFAGHSLGEYGCLSCVVNSFRIEGVIETTFLRGITMQVAVVRDAQGRSPYAMAAANPSRVGKFCTDAVLEGTVAAISAAAAELLQLVNFNVRGSQYVAAGTRRCVAALGVALDAMKKAGAAPQGAEQMQAAAAAALGAVKARYDADPYGMPERGQATVPLPGIDVPFHSRLLRSGVPTFRKILLDRMTEVRASTLDGRFVPNLLGKPFRTDKAYAEAMLRETESPVLRELVAGWEGEVARLGLDGVAKVMLIESMAYQFASPVRWIETQEFLFAPAAYGAERVVEIGPAKTLCGMAKLLLGSIGRDAELLSTTERDPILYALPDVAPSDAPPPAPAAPAPAPAPAPAAAAPVAVVAASGSPLADAPVAAVDVVRVALCMKLKKGYGEVSDGSKSIKDFCGGKSAIQNEIVGDLDKEFAGQTGDGAAEASLDSLAARPALASYARLGTVASAWVARMIAAKMPAGYGAAQVKGYLAGRRLLGEGRSQAVQLHALAMEPPARLASEADANAFWDAVCDAYGAAHGVRVPVAGAGGAAGGAAAGGAGAVVDSKALDAMKKLEAELLATQIRAMEHALRELRGGKGERHEAAAAAAGPLLAGAAAEEFGQEYIDAVRPMFDANRERRYDSAWNWARADALELFHALVAGEHMAGDTLLARLHSLRNRACPELAAYARAAVDEATRAGAPAAAAAFEELLTELAKGPAPVFRDFATPTMPRVEITQDGKVIYEEVPRPGICDASDYVREMARGGARAADEHARPLLYLKRHGRSEGHKEAGALEREYSPACTATFLEALAELASPGVTFRGRTALVHGCDRGSIAAELVKALLAAGARVIAGGFADPTGATSGGRPGMTAAQHEHFRALFREHGAAGAELIVVPFNGASSQDCANLVAYVYETLKADVDYFVPFSAVPEAGRDIGKIDARSELAHRVMLTNTVRMMGAIKNEKEKRGVNTRPAHVVLPLSPNHGLFGGDGLYSESKIGLEVLLEKWASEGWRDYLTLAGAVIGWTRGTGLMNANNWTAAAFEKEGARTFSAKETAFNLLGLLHPRVVTLAEHEPVWADLSGGFERIPDLAAFARNARREITERSQGLAAAWADATQEKGAKRPVAAIEPKASPAWWASFPRLPSPERLEQLRELRGLVDLEKTVVIAGFGEVGPFGSARVRWEYERSGRFGLAAAIELAFTMGMVKYHHGPLARGFYTGWLDAKTKEPLTDSEVGRKYERDFLEHTGIRVIEPDVVHVDPNHKEFLRQVVIERELPPFEVASPAEAELFRRQHGDKAEVWVEGEGDEARCLCRLHRGAVLYVPKATTFDRFVAGQIPTGWSPATYGIPKDIVDQVEPTCLYTLVAVVDALASAGVTDPYELYQYVHPSEVGNAIGGGMGGAKALQNIFVKRRMEQTMAADTLQETFINTVPAWVNMLLLSASGPIKTPVGACATAAQSVEVGAETILSGKAKVMLVGGYDDFAEETAYEFAQMKATVNCVEDAARGREPREMSRPTTSSRAGFVESHGTGTQVLMTADLAIRIGAPIYGVVAFARTASDRQGKSVPAPGCGIMSFAKEEHPGGRIPLPSLAERRAALAAGRAAAEAYRAAALKEAGADAAAVEQRAARIERAAAKMAGSAAAWQEGADAAAGAPAPMRAGLAQFGLTPDDIGLASLHGTSTKANEKNEFMVLHEMLDHLGRREGHPVPIVCQKHLTGHPKGAAAAWMLNGLLQAMAENVVPPNRNADNVAAELRPYTNILTVDRALRLPAKRPIHAGMLTSFGFGQAGAALLVVSPEHVLGALEPAALAEYAAKREARLAAARRFHHEVLAAKRPFVAVKGDAPYASEDMHAPVRPAPPRPAPPAPAADAAGAGRPRGAGGGRAGLQSAAEAAGRGRRRRGLRGVDVEEIGLFRGRPAGDLFLERNFTPAELAHCARQPDPASSLAGRWAAKEAVVKALGAASEAAPATPANKGLRGSAAPLREIELAAACGLAAVAVSIAHSGEYAVAHAHAAPAAPLPAPAPSSKAAPRTQAA